MLKYNLAACSNHITTEVRRSCGLPVVTAAVGQAVLAAGTERLALSLYMCVAQKQPCRSLNMQSCTHVTRA